MNCTCGKLRRLAEDSTSPFAVDDVTGRFTLSLTPDQSISDPTCPYCGGKPPGTRLSRLSVCGRGELERLAAAPPSKVQFNVVVEKGYSLSWADVGIPLYFCPSCGGITEMALAVFNEPGQRTTLAWPDRLPF